MQTIHGHLKCEIFVSTNYIFLYRSIHYLIAQDKKGPKWQAPLIPCLDSNNIMKCFSVSNTYFVSTLVSKL